MPILKPTVGTDFERTHIPAGQYTATLAQIDAIEMPDYKNPEGPKVPRLRWTFLIERKSTGETKTLEGITSYAWGAGVPGKTVPKAWRWAQAILNDTPPEEVDTDELLGRVCNIKVADKADKHGQTYSYVDDIVPPAVVW